MTSRLNRLQQWATNQLGAPLQLESIQGDASFRQYYRVVEGGVSYIVVDSPPDTENNQAFVALSLMLKRQGLNVPEVLSFQETDGFMLMTDLGEVLLLDLFDNTNANHWYQQVFLILRQIQLCPLNTGFSVPSFDDKFISKECHYFSEWCVSKLLGLTLTKSEQNVLLNLFAQFIPIFESQPQVLTHRDFHSRNLMVLPSQAIAVIDYQDAMIAPVTYDLVSMLKDCYISWPQDLRLNLVKEYYQLLLHEKMIDVPFETFKMWFDWVGLQRHLKVLGIFSRLNLRDNKKRYLYDTPRILQYIKEVLPQYEALAPFESFFYEKIWPKFEYIWEREGIKQVA